MSLIDARASLLNCRQQPDQTVNDYADKLRTWAETIEHHGGIVAENYELIHEKDDDDKTRSIDERKQSARDRTLAMLLLRGADRARYGTLIADLANQQHMGRDEYPVDLTEAQGGSGELPSSTSQCRESPASRRDQRLFRSKRHDIRPDQW